MAGGESWSIKSNSEKQEGKRRQTKSRREIFFPHLFPSPCPVPTLSSRFHWRERGEQQRAQGEKEKQEVRSHRGLEYRLAAPVSRWQHTGNSVPSAQGPTVVAWAFLGSLPHQHFIAEVLFRNT